MKKSIEDLVSRMRTLREMAGEFGDMDIDDKDIWACWEREIEPYECPEENERLDGAHGAYLEYMKEYDPKKYNETLSSCMHVLWDYMLKEEQETVILMHVSASYEDILHLHETKDFFLKWHCGYWDGPLSGMLELTGPGRLAWFDCSDDGIHGMNERVRLFKVYQLTDEQIEEETYWHQLFFDKVGTHTDYQYKDGKRWRPGDEKGAHLRSYDIHHEFYDAAKKERKKLDLSGAEVIGWWFLY